MTSAVDLTELRVVPRGASYWFPFERFTAAMFCPQCDCTKSGDRRQPNNRQPECERPECPCHDEALP